MTVRVPPLLLMLCLSVPCAAQVTEGRTKFDLPDTTKLTAAEREIIRLERRRSAAIAAHDTAALTRIYASDFHGVTAFGVEVDRSALLAMFAQDDGSATFEIDRLTVHAVDAAGTVAMLSGRLRTYRGTSPVAHARYLHVYRRRAGRWEIVGAEATAVAAR